MLGWLPQFFMMFEFLGFLRIHFKSIPRELIVKCQVIFGFRLYPIPNLSMYHVETSGDFHLRRVTSRFAHFPVRPESFRPESFRPRIVSPFITWVISPSYPESFRPLFGESFRPLSKFIFYWGYGDKFAVFDSFNEDLGYISLKKDMSFINWSKWYIYLYSV